MDPEYLVDCIAPSKEEPVDIVDVWAPKSIIEIENLEGSGAWPWYLSSKVIIA